MTVGEAPRGPGPSHLCRNTGFRRKPSVGELEAPSVPTYCSTYRARCWGDRGRDGPWRQWLRGPSSASLPKLQADPDMCWRPADEQHLFIWVGQIHPGQGSDGLWSFTLKWINPCCITASLHPPCDKFTRGMGGPSRGESGARGMGGREGRSGHKQQVGRGRDR